MAIDPTKARLLEAAGQEFAGKGFEGATVRAICDRAGANLAAINYHFGDKEQLYVQAVLEAHRCGTDMPPDVPANVPAAEALRVYVGHFLRNVAGLRDETWHRTLMLREMVSPSSASEVLVNEAIRPRFERLSAILRRLVPGADERQIHALTFSVVGQCLHYKISREISERIIGAEAFAALDLDYLADHITRFTLAALGVLPPIEGNDTGVEAERASWEGRR